MRFTFVSKARCGEIATKLLARMVPKNCLRKFLLYVGSRTDRKSPLALTSAVSPWKAERHVTANRFFGSQITYTLNCGTMFLGVGRCWRDDAVGCRIRLSRGDEIKVPRITSRSWTPNRIARLRELAAAGASPARISGAVNRSMAAIRTMAAKLDIELRGIQQIRASKKALEATHSR